MWYDIPIFHLNYGWGEDLDKSKYNLTYGGSSNRGRGMKKSKNSDIIWNKSISEIDQQLYKKYGLSNAEIAFIESHVKEME